MTRTVTRTVTRARSERRRGMTLVEAMVSIAILSVVSVMVWGGFAQTSRNKERVEADLERNHVVSAALARMQREATASTSRPSPTEGSSATLTRATRTS